MDNAIAKLIVEPCGDLLMSVRWRGWVKEN
jgi:hypothetical protein